MACAGRRHHACKWQSLLPVADARLTSCVVCPSQVMGKAVLVSDGVPKNIIPLEGLCSGLVARADPAIVLAGQTIIFEALSSGSGSSGAAPGSSGGAKGSGDCQVLCRADGRYHQWQVGAPFACS